jgi:hypothetical protein
MAAFFKRRVPAYLGGLLLSLAAMVVILQAKKAFAPRFHEIRDDRPPVILAQGAAVKIIYSEEPGYFLPPGFPTQVTVMRKGADGTFVHVSRLAYRNLVDREAAVAILFEAGEYTLEGELHICAAPGVADCARLVLNRRYVVEPSGQDKESRIEVDLPKLAAMGAEMGKTAPGAPETK